MNEITINKDKVAEVYQNASAETKEALKALFGHESNFMSKPKPTLDDYTTIKTYEDACEAFRYVGSEYNIGEYLYSIPDSEESAKYNPENQRVFIHDGYVNGDGYGKVIGWHDGEIKKSTGYGNFCWGAGVRKATDDEIESFIKSIHRQECIKPY